LQHYDVIVIGGGGAGLMCALTAGQRGRRVTLLEHNARVGLKIAISGGGRCNFTNLLATPENYISGNPRFCASALARFTPQDFIALVEKHKIPYHEKTLGQLFCDGSAQQVIDLLLSEMRQGGVELHLSTKVERIEKTPEGFVLHLSGGDDMQCRSLVIATGGKSIPKMGASDFGYRAAAQFGLGIVPTRPALVRVA